VRLSFLGLDGVVAIMGMAAVGDYRPKWATK
jgi:hypothetical protein